MRRGHQLAGAGHRHGRGGPGDPGRCPAVGGQRPPAHRARRARGGRGVGGGRLSAAPRGPGPGRGHHRTHARRGDRGAQDPATPARRPRPTARGRRGRSGRRRARRGRVVRHRDPRPAVRRPGARPAGLRRRAAHRRLPGCGLRRVEGAARPRRRRAALPPPRSAAPGRDLGGHHPGPRDVRRLPRLRRAGVAPRRGARRGDGLRVAGGRRLHAGRLRLADRGDHAGPGARLPRARPHRPPTVLARRRRGPARGARAPDRASAARDLARPDAARPPAARREHAREPGHLHRGAAGRDRSAARRHHRGSREVP